MKIMMKGVQNDMLKFVKIFFLNHLSIHFENLSAVYTRHDFAYISIYFRNGFMSDF